LKQPEWFIADTNVHLSMLGYTSYCKAVVYEVVLLLWIYSKASNVWLVHMVRSW